MDDILTTLHMRKTYGGICVLDDVDFSLRKGEVHALVGENGAGKSTLIKIIAGVVAPDAGGGMYFAGERIPFMTTLLSRQLGISVIYQDISLFPNLSVAENIYCGMKRKGAHRRGDMNRVAGETLKRMGIELDLTRTLSEISVGQQQLVAIARAIAFQAKVIVMDEPTASLSSSEVEMLYAVIESLKKDGVGIIYISHKFDEIFRIADRISVLRDGKLVATDEVGAFDQKKLIQLMVGRELHFIPCHNELPLGKELFSVKGLTSEPHFRDINLSVREHEILGITGLVGAGRSELAQAIFGLSPAQSGEIVLHGKRVAPRTAREAIDAGICYLPEDRREQGLFMLKSMRVNTTTASMRKVLGAANLIAPAKEQAIAEETIKSLDIRPALPELNALNFSGGNQQKILVGRWLTADPKLLIVDEVTSGVDVGVKTEIHRLLRSLAASGVAVIVISSDLPEILAVSDRIAIMRKGTLVDTVAVGDATQESVLEKSMLLKEG